MAAAHPYASHPQCGWDLPSALVVGDTEAAVRRGERTFEAAERPAGRALPAEALARLDRRDLETVWLEIEGSLDAPLEALLRRVDADFWRAAMEP